MADKWRLVYGGTEREISADLAKSIQESVSELAMDEDQGATAIDVRGAAGEQMVLLLSPSIPILLIREPESKYNVVNSVF